MATKPSNIPQSAWDSMPESVKQQVSGTAQITPTVTPTVAPSTDTTPNIGDLTRGFGPSIEDDSLAPNEGDYQKAYDEALDETAPQIPSVPNAPQTPAVDYQQTINDMIAAQRKSRIAQLDNLLASGNSALDSEQSTINPMIWNKKNAAGAQSDVGAYSFAQRAASMGVKGNNAQLPEIYRNNALQGQIGALDQQETQLNADVARKRTDLQNSYNNDVVSANNDLDAQQLQATLETMLRQQQIDLQKAGLTGQLNGTPTLAMLQYQNGLNQQTIDNARADAALTGVYNGNQTLAAQQQALDNQFRQNQFDWNKQADLWNRAFQQGQFNYQKLRDSASDHQWYADYKLKLDEYTWNKNFDNPEIKSQVLDNQIKDLQLKNLPEQQKLELEQLRKQIAQIGAVKPVSQFELQKQTLELDKLRAEIKKIEAGKAPYGQNPQFQSEVSDIDSGKATLEDVQANSTELQAAYGYDGYQELVKRAMEKKKANNPTSWQDFIK